MTNFIYTGDILLVPVIMNDINKASDTNIPCGAIHGAQFLLITGLFGGYHIVGRFLSYLFQNRLPSAKTFMACSCTCLPFAISSFVFSDNVKKLIIGLVFIQIITSMGANEAYIQMNDKGFFTVRHHAVAAGVLTCVLQVNTIITCVISEIMLMVHTACSVLSVLVSLLFLSDEHTSDRNYCGAK